MASLTSSGWPGSATVSAYAGMTTSGTAAASVTASAAGVASFTGLTPGALYTLSDGTTSKRASAEPVQAGADKYYVETLAAGTHAMPSAVEYKQVKYILGGNVTLTAPTPSEGQFFTLILRQDATGSRTVAWSATPNIDWVGGSAPTITTTASSTDILEFRSDDGIRWLAYRSAAAVA